MTTAPALEWLRADFERGFRRYQRNRRAQFFDEHWHGPSVIQPMIQLRTLLDGGIAMTIIQADYGDPQRWWL